MNAEYRIRDDLVALRGCDIVINLVLGVYTMACLFSHKWNDCKCEKCGKTRDEQHVWKGCVCSVCGQERSIDKITDQSVLAYIAINEKVKQRRDMAVDMLNDQVMLAEVVSKTGDYKTSGTALNKIKDQTILANFAKNSNSTVTRMAAVTKIVDQSILIEIVKNERVNDIRVAAAEKITSQDLVKELFPDFVEAKAKIDKEKARIKEQEDCKHNWNGSYCVKCGAARDD